MAIVDSDGMLIDVLITPRRYTALEHGDLKVLNAIIVHQTDSYDSDSVFSSYSGNSGIGAHFLIERDGKIYQTASLKKRCFHVGKRIKSKCVDLEMNTCDATRAKMLAAGLGYSIAAIDKLERQKTYPDRYPTNSDSVGIELVGKFEKTTNAYQAVSAQQNTSLQYLIDIVYELYSITSNDVYKHPQVSYKNPGEAGTALWK
ncbi:peptidoglycan recognition protein family protein [Pseudomonas mangiferae]|uniref:N-acetylmuramoyl-L-alanine amidase n=1 Tax=Pseudomonas mangiferae TaxID=2593654 RepID=A0A553GZ04_9PSED|nr:peptidoglycan recognition family protein [Pseudomonas mangiferae]TRX74748.1 N-acetylmuramoyl-L-alanine amidase [Pseudomonas mangiferae]